MAKKSKEKKSGVLATQEQHEYQPREDVAGSIDLDAMADALHEDTVTGAAVPTGYRGPEPSRLQNPYLSEEDQGVQLAAKTVGPPQYGSPDPATAAGSLLTLEDGHPLDMLPEGHPSAISEDYAADVLGTNGEEIDATDGARKAAEENDVDLRAVQGTGKDGKVTKEDVDNYVAERDGNQS